MPGSCESDQSSSSSSTLISNLRRFRFQKSKQNQAASSSTPSSSIPNRSTNSAPIRNVNSSTTNNHLSQNKTANSTKPSLAQKSNSTGYSPLNYRNYTNKNDVQSLLQSISAKIQTSFKSNVNNLQILDLKLTIPENDQFKDIILKYTSLSVKWSSCVTETSTLNPSEKFYKIKKPYLWELNRHISQELNTNLSTKNSNISGTNSPVRTYSRTKGTAKPVETNPRRTSPINSYNSQPAKMDDYEEFCEKEQALRKMLDAFPGADIMEAQDILVKCQWNLNKAIQEANSQPLRSARKRGPQSSPGDQTIANAQQNQNSSSSFPEEIVLDSSDEEDINGSVSSRNSQTSTAPPPAKRARRPISTSSSEDGAAGRKTNSSMTPNNQKQQQKGVVQKNPNILTSKPSTSPQPAAATKPAPSAQHIPVTPVQAKPTTQAQPKPAVTPKPMQVSPPPSAQRSETSSPSSVSDSSVDKTINIPKGLSLQPVVATPTSTSNNEESKSVPAMPNLPKWLCVTQVGSDSNNKEDSKETSATVSVNGNPPNNIPSGSNKSAQLVRIKSSNSVSVTPTTVSKTTTPISMSSQLSCTPVGQNVTFTPVSKSVSVTPVSQTKSAPNATMSVSKMLSITPVGGGSLTESQDKSNSSAEEQEKSATNVPKKGRIKNKETLKDNDNQEEKEEPDVIIREQKLKKKRKSGKTTTKRKRCSSDEGEDEDYGNEDIYDSEDSDCGREKLTPAHNAVLKFFQEATADEIGSIPGCSKKKLDAILKIRPINSWADLVNKLRNDKCLSTDLLNGAKKVLDMRNSISKLMTKCQRISLDMEDLVENLKENKESCTGYVNKQPELLNERMHLTAYQMLGLNWLLLMHSQEVNGILADEMGLGKTVQAIAFLAYLKQIEEEGPHLIVVPSSTLDNWKKELDTWWPGVSVISYHGQQESRRELRMQILNDEVDEFDIMITTYSMVTSSAEDRSFFKRLEFNYVIFDEAHMLKNMSSQRYTNLMRIKAPRRLLLTGTPLQNNLVELMSLLIFAMPHMFSGKTEQIKQMFTCVSKADGNKNTYEKDRIDHAKRIMKPFVLRRLKKDVLKELPAKVEETRFCPMVEDQENKYKDLVKRFTAEVEDEKTVASSGSGMMMQLRRAANHPLLLRRFYDDDKLLIISQEMLKEPTHTLSDPNMIFEDMAVMSDFELHKLCKQYKSINSHALPDEAILNSGKFKVLDELLSELIKEDHRILLFSQFTMVLDIVQEYMDIKKYKFLRLDGQTPVTERQQLIDEFNNDPEIYVFLLSTKAGGVGINLTAADTVILHDIDFNPYNDKQAEDRCHRVGQMRDVRVIRFISKDSIEEGILQRAKEKLKLEKEIHEEETEETDIASVVKLLRDALGIKSAAATN